MRRNEGVFLVSCQEEGEHGVEVGGWVLEDDRVEYGVVRRFEDLVAWQRARELTADIYRITRHGTLSRDRGLSDQLQRAAVSIMANIAEGYERGSPREFHRFLWYAKGSCGEVRSHLYVAHDAGHIDESTFAQYYELCERVGQLIGGLRKSAANRIRERST